MYRAPRSVRRTLIVLATAALLGGGALAGCGSSSDTSGTGKTGTTTTKRSDKPTAAAAHSAQLRLDGAMIDIWNAANTVSSKPYACLRRAPRGGPELLKCVATCQSCTVSMSKLERRLRKAYRAAPTYVRRYYHSTYTAQIHNMQDHRSALRALGEYARVHGASSYQGMTEFDRAKRLIKIEDASAKVWQRRIAKARKRFDAYLAKLD